MVEAPVNFEKKSERLTLHGVTGFIPRVLPVLPVLQALHVLQALPVIPKIKSSSYTHSLMVNHDKTADISSSCVWGIRLHIRYLHTHTL